MIVKDFAKIIERIAPIESAMDFDNVGLLVGSLEKEVTKVLICVDVTSDVIEEAIECDCNLIISHHPIIFNPIKRFLNDDYINDIIAKAFVNGINIYAAHTNVDRMEGNMSWLTLKSLGCNSIGKLQDDGIGAIGDLENPITLGELKDILEPLLSDTLVKVVGDKNMEISCVAMVNGAGADSVTLRTALDRGGEVLITSDVKHHIMLEALAIDLPIIEVGHYASEKIFIDIVYDSIKCYFDTTKIIKHYEGNPYN
ncbi:MAG: Nif3-like dinuclear metal center hexameric protein [Clostridia bacterium]